MTELIAIGVAIIGASLIHQFLTLLPSAIGGIIICAIVWGGLDVFGHNAPLPSSARPPAMDYIIAFQCDESSLPRRRRPSGKILLLDIWLPPPPDKPEMFQGYGSFPEGEDPINWGIKRDQVYRCSFTNYGKTAIAAVRAIFSVDVTDPESKTTTPVRVNMPPLGLDVAPNNTRDFYVWNESVYFLKVTYPIEAQIMLPGEKVVWTTKLNEANSLHSGFFLYPHSIFPNPPSSPSSSPSPMPPPGASPRSSAG